MLDRLTGKPVHLYIHIFSCIGLAGGLPASKIPLSLATMLLVLNILLEAKFKDYWQNLKTNKLAWGLWFFIACEWISLLWTTDFSYALHDFNAKLPLYSIPLVLVIKPITERKHLYLIGAFFLASVFVISFINVGTYMHWWGNKTYDDIRGLSLFGSHIRFALMIVMGIALCITWFIERLPHRIIPFILIVWWLWYTYFSQIISGYLSVGILLLVSVLFLLYSLKKRWLKNALLLTGLLVTGGFCWWIIAFFQPTPHKISLKNPDRYTVNGNWYRTDMNHVIWENGYPVIAFISEVELEKSWNAASKIDYKTGKDRKNQPLYLTLWRYMSSKGLRKDSLGFSSMSKTDIRFVEDGFASVCLTKGGFKARLHGLKHQLEHPENPNGHSLLQRLEYWKAARAIIKENWLLGVGSGDVDQRFKLYYNTHSTLLQPELQLRAHNQYMTSWISSGIFGLIGFLAWWFAFLFIGWKKRSFIVVAFAGIAMSSFLIEDTLETLMGVVFISLFYGLLVGSQKIWPTGKM
ncbi:MAG: hypothetical protein A3D31_13240 [Candidatus Fluviicola riflensis]|nr:MAG: hypothetical protein CHH17_17675 [Candidatus Fluviicola riflensis]OGS77943.1 MAG: hypothetical protein A3D31_13240 [Candidatus Fluviicola riflensis]OGS85008.1 MAG: hypothetical protein A2724_10175 [Fluviicola sp. RIFCSPHIGHO2_01_FULL_43_53]OGS89280.1 MAG: hypothetical protein A3E30_04480 [Fluviicola sp. RIFCSPHIGHO2_12_FULL_43_24]